MSEPGTGEQVLKPASPEELFVQGVVQDALAVYADLSANPNQIADASKGFKGARLRAKEQQNETLRTLYDSAVALSILGGMYEDPVAVVEPMESRHNNRAAIALYRTGERDKAKEFLYDQLDISGVMPELMTLAGLGDQDAMRMVAKHLDPNQPLPIFDALATIIKTSINAHVKSLDTVALESLFGENKIYARFGGDKYRMGAAAAALTRTLYGWVTNSNALGGMFNVLQDQATTVNSSLNNRSKVRFLELRQGIEKRFGGRILTNNFEAEKEQEALRTDIMLSGRPEIIKLMDILPFAPDLSVDVIAAFNKLSADKRAQYILPMAVALGQAGKHHEAAPYLEALTGQDKIEAAYQIATFYYDKNVRYTLERARPNHEVNQHMAALIGHVGTGPRIDVSQLEILEHLERQEIDDVLADIDTQIEMAATGSGRYVSPELEKAKHLALIRLGSDRLRYEAFKRIRESEQALAREHLCEEPANMPPYKEWVQAIQDKDTSWWSGFTDTSKEV